MRYDCYQKTYTVGMFAILKLRHDVFILCKCAVSWVNNSQFLEGVNIFQQ